MFEYSKVRNRLITNVYINYGSVESGDKPKELSINSEHDGEHIIRIAKGKIKRNHKHKYDVSFNINDLNKHSTKSLGDAKNIIELLQTNGVFKASRFNHHSIHKILEILSDHPKVMSISIKASGKKISDKKLRIFYKVYNKKNPQADVVWKKEQAEWDSQKKNGVAYMLEERLQSIDKNMPKNLSNDTQITLPTSLKT